MTSYFRKLVRGVPIALAILFVLAGTRSASAGCFENLWACYQRAANRDTFLERSLAGADCELEFAGCTRQAVLGR